MSQVDQKYKSRENSREKPVPTVKKEPSDSEDDDYYFKNKENK